MKKYRILNLLISLVVTVIFEIFTYRLTKDILVSIITAVSYICLIETALETFQNLLKRKRVKFNICKLVLCISGIMTFFSFTVAVLAVEKPSIGVPIFMVAFMIFLLSLGFFVIRKWE